MTKLQSFQNFLIFCIVALGIGVGLYGAFQGWYSSGFASVIASSGLVLATTLSLITTRNTLHEQRLAREQQAKPLLRLDLEKVTLGAYSIMVENVGNGPAKDVDVTIKAISSDGQRDSVQDEIGTPLPVISPSESIAVSVGLDDVEDPTAPTSKKNKDSGDHRLFESVDQINKKDLQDISHIYMTGTCRDILDTEHEIDSIFYTKYAEEGMAQYGRHDTASELRKIEQSLSKVRNEMSSLRQEISR
ncbi:hypothetical protein [Haloferax sp. Atlit-4N]|uniref:hypothetical protein n=1 Tax=Haloferax sp. Atlit-4N TaxID=2077206 RepID=UPI0011C07473|nr:hypothetical protein [Haloferax sp. Atlit-4N]